MLLTLLLLLGLSECTVAGDKKLALGGTEARPWEGVVPSIRLQLQEVKRGKESQFFGLMGKKAGRNTSYPSREKNGASMRTDGPGPPTQERTIYRRQRTRGPWIRVRAHCMPPRE